MQRLLPRTSEHFHTQIMLWNCHSYMFSINVDQQTYKLERKPFSVDDWSCCSCKASRHYWILEARILHQHWKVSGPFSLLSWCIETTCPCIAACPSCEVVSLKTTALPHFPSPHCTLQNEQGSFVIMTVLWVCKMFAASGVIPAGPWEEAALANSVAARDIAVVLLSIMNG